MRARARAQPKRALTPAARSASAPSSPTPPAGNRLVLDALQLQGRRHFVHRLPRAHDEVAEAPLRLLKLARAMALELLDPARDALLLLLGTVVQAAQTD